MSQTQFWQDVHGYMYSEDADIKRITQSVYSRIIVWFQCEPIPGACINVTRLFDIDDCSYLNGNFVALVALQLREQTGHVVYLMADLAANGIQVYAFRS